MTDFQSVVDASEQQTGSLFCKSPAALIRSPDKEKHKCNFLLAVDGFDSLEPALIVQFVFFVTIRQQDSL